MSNYFLNLIAFPPTDPLTDNPLTGGDGYSLEMLLFSFGMPSQMRVTSAPVSINALVGIPLRSYKPFMQRIMSGGASLPHPSSTSAAPLRFPLPAVLMGLHLPHLSNLRCSQDSNLAGGRQAVISSVEALPYFWDSPLP